MPIEYRIDHDRRLVLAKALGKLTDPEVFGYQREVWSRPDVAGYDELIDMSEVESINLVSVARIVELARLSATMDANAPGSKFAIFAAGDLAFGLGRMYQVHRGLDEGSRKQVGVFRSLKEALEFLGLAFEPSSRVPKTSDEHPREDQGTNSA